ncbi:DNA methyltransferase [Cryobacterium sp. 10S3]|uniref:DNA-methyltransferase n=1 Tax=unclassified Cryobacterium TaxID=2649013 RepID=UPI002AC91F86|nr:MULTISPECIES: DNA methyltransferase [unclassified Cryobacterium]MEB0004741.1 DNA methyltransferase [Cryobacterium sp. RTC2.1]MEB0288705.1 DNA methyltransferase [Cryobacterium sp. 10S3]WPX13199.1 DNA methyltransferase [Cryobacterium sp. 10S3]
MTTQEIDSRSKRELVSVLHGDAWDLLKDFPPSMFDCVLTDPPFAIGLTKNEYGRPHWDRSKIAMNPDFWQEVRRVMKPGSNLLAFGHPKTFARMSVAIEDAGFEVVDCLALIHGQGFAAGFRHLDAELTRVGATDAARDYVGFGNMLRPALEPILMFRNKSPRESMANVIAAGGVGGLNVDACRIPAGMENRSRTPGIVNGNQTWRVDRPAGAKSTPPPAGRLPSNVLLHHTERCTKNHCLRECPVAQVHDQGLSTRGRNEDATRFYQTFFHHPKASKSERPEVGGMSGPTVKSLAVMDWLVQLVTRPGQLVLDPFAGTGTTLEACARAGRRSIGFEKEAAYLPLIEQRLERLG